MDVTGNLCTISGECVYLDRGRRESDNNERCESEEVNKRRHWGLGNDFFLYRENEGEPVTVEREKGR